MVGEVRQVFADVLADIPGFPAYLAVIAPGLCAWFIVWAKEKKENPRHRPAVKPKSPVMETKRGDSR